jgi:Rad3-related DNA helicase
MQMPTGTGKTITLLSLVTAYQLAHPDKLGKLVYCTRTVPEMEKCLIELRELVEYRSKYMKEGARQILALGLSSRKNLCIHKSVSGALRCSTAEHIALLYVSRVAGPSHTCADAMCTGQVTRLGLCGVHTSCTVCTGLVFK